MISVVIFHLGMLPRILRQNTSSRARCLGWLLCIFFAVFSKTYALEVTSPQSLVTRHVFDSATFAYYGPQTEINLRAPGIVILESSARCIPDLESVKGKIVIIG